MLADCGWEFSRREGALIKHSKRPKSKNWSQSKGLVRSSPTHRPLFCEILEVQRAASQQQTASYARLAARQRGLLQVLHAIETLDSRIGRLLESGGLFE